MKKKPYEKYFKNWLELLLLFTAIPERKDTNWNK